MLPTSCVPIRWSPCDSPRHGGVGVVDDGKNQVFYTGINVQLNKSNSSSLSPSILPTNSLLPTRVPRLYTYVKRCPSFLPAENIFYTVLVKSEVFSVLGLRPSRNT